MIVLKKTDTELASRPAAWLAHYGRLIPAGLVGDGGMPPRQGWCLASIVAVVVPRTVVGLRYF